MNHTCTATVLQLVRRQIELYQSLLGIQKEKILLLMQHEEQLLETASTLENDAIAEIRQCQQRLRSALGGLSMQQWLQKLSGSRQGKALRSLLNRLGQLVAEAAAVNLRNFRHAQTALAYNQAMLEQGFGFQAGYGSDGSRREAGDRSPEAGRRQVV